MSIKYTGETIAHAFSGTDLKLHKTFKKEFEKEFNQQPFTYSQLTAYSQKHSSK